jgi:hypothetical protein
VFEGMGQRADLREQQDQSDQQMTKRFRPLVRSTTP